MTPWHFLEIAVDDLTDVVWQSQTAPALADNQIVCRIDRCSFTANNITYGATGHQIGYWKFFPATSNGRGRLPVWGFATVVESTHPEVSVGETLYGYWPLGTHLVLEPDRVRAQAFVDASQHRAALPAVYNQYSRCPADPLFQPETTDLQALFRPLFMTSFMIDDFLDDHAFFGANSVIISSASSKTAIGSAFLLNQRSNVNVTGLTSSGNVEYVESLNCYDNILNYQNVSSLPQQPAVYVDITGNTRLRGDIHHHLLDHLKFSSAVGYSHVGTMEQGIKLPGPKPEFFFAPTQIQKRAVDWRDSGGVMGHHLKAWKAFLPFASEHFQIDEHRGQLEILELYRECLYGKVDPKLGHIIDLGHTVDFRS